MKLKKKLSFNLKNVEHCIPRSLIDQSVVEKAEANLKEITHTLEVVTKKV